LILSIDSADYKSALEQTKADAARARLELALEEGRQRQAIKDWERLGGDEIPTPLVKREPQLESAKAAIAAAEAAVAKAQRDLDRTDLRAPYHCRIARKHTELGSFVGTGSPLADVENARELKVRLPISLDDTEFIPAISKEAPINVTLVADFNGNEKRWPAKVLREEGEVERTSRSVFVVASIKKTDSEPRLQPGLFVRAEIQGKKLESVFRVPRYAFLDPTRILVVEKSTEEGRNGQTVLRFREVNVLRTEAEESLVVGGLSPGDHVCLTAIDAPIDGSSVNVSTADPASGSVVIEPKTAKKP
ncbi:MAG: efflux RND transporter periplasmic adaptor subunit, partial [Verrucomicrobiota bacterium]